MVIQVIVALLLGCLGVHQLGEQVERALGGNATKGRFSNALEAILLFMRDEVARPAIGHGADKYVPLLWSIFFFVLGLNLMGMLPWMGAPTGAFACTLGLAGVTLLTGIVMGSKKFGSHGFLAESSAIHGSCPSCWICQSRGCSLLSKCWVCLLNTACSGFGFLPTCSPVTSFCSGLWGLLLVCRAAMSTGVVDSSSNFGD